MKKAMYGLLVAIVFVGMLGWAAMGPRKAGAEEGLAAQGAPGPEVVVVTPMVKMSNKAKFSIMGSGFKPGEEVRLLFTTMDGVEANIGYALEPQPVANKVGAWITTWSCGRYIKRKLITEGAYTITVTDSKYNKLAHAPVAFYAEKESEKK
jgi:hypothetical protein